MRTNEEGKPARHRRYASKGKPTNEYIIWQRMIARCTNPENPAWADYGGRGITVCDRWLCFDNFVDDLGRKPYDDATIERVDVNDGYHPDNVVWLPLHLQNRNKRNTIWVEHNGERKRLKTVAEEEGVPYIRLWKRTQQQGLTLQQALAKPTDRTKHRFFFKNQLLTVADVVRMSGRPSGSVHHDLVVKKLSVEETLARV